MDSIPPAHRRLLEVLVRIMGTGRPALLEKAGGHPRTVRRLSVLLRWLIVAALAVGLLLAWHMADAETLEGHVIHVADGDTITVLDAKHQQLRIRLGGIDAPERRQAFSKRSTEHLSKLVRRQIVTVEWYKKDRYGRLVGTVYVKGRDVGLEQVRVGLAWHYKRYEREQTPEERARYAAAEEQARAGRMGLWQDGVPVAPWEWRRKNRDKLSALTGLFLEKRGRIGEDTCTCT